MDRNLAAIVTSSENIETEVLSSNNVLTLITTEDGIPTSTEVTFLPAEVVGVPSSSHHPTFVTSHGGGLRTVYTTSLIPSISNAIAGQAVVLSNGQLAAVMGTDGIRRALVYHAAGPEHMEIAEIGGETQNVVTVEGVDIQIQEATTTDFPTTTVVLTEEEANRLTQGSDSEVLGRLQEVPMSAEVISSAEVNVNALVEDQALVIESPPEGQSTTATSVEVAPAHEEPKPASRMEEEVEGVTITITQGKTSEVVKSSEATEVMKQEPQLDEKLAHLKQENIKIQEKSSEVEVPAPIPEVPVVPPPIPEDVVCLVCYESFKNPKARKDDADTNPKENENSSGTKQFKDLDLPTYGRTLGKFFEISRINMSIVTRRSYKDYEVPLCQACSEKLNQAEKFLEELKQLERKLYYLRQEIKEAIVSSHCVFKKKENKEVLEHRKEIAGLADILSTVDHIRMDIINDGRPPRIPRSMTGKKPGRKPKKNADEAGKPILEQILPSAPVTESKPQTSNTESVATASVDTFNLPTTDPHSTEKAEFREAGLNEAKVETSQSTPQKDEENDVKPAIRTSFGRLVKRPAYMLNDVTDIEELSDIDEESEDNYEELEVKPTILDEGEPGVVNEELEEEDPAWSPGRGMFIDDEKIISVSSEESEYLSDDSDDVDGVPKTKIKKEPRLKKSKRSKTKTTKKRGRTKKSQGKNLIGEMGYEVKVIQLDGTELMSINTNDENGIGLEPDITQKVMDSQAVIMVKNQLFGKRVQCPHCPRSFTDAARRDVHVKKKHEGVAKPFECVVCRKSFGRQDHLKNHMKRHTRPPRDKSSPKPRHLSSEKNHACEFCGQRFRNKSELLVHTRLHTGEKPFKCEHCSESFISTLKKEFHIEQAHPEFAPLKCEFCPKAYFRQHRLRIHAVSHTGEKTNICEICGKSFSQAAMLRYHQTTHEELHLKQFKCQECSRVFANPQNLKSHMESQHQKVYRHRCDTCGRGYTQMSHLRRHLRTHSGEQPFACSYCPKKFTSGAALKIHVRIHTGERPYWCAQCEKGFRSKTKLGRHLKTLIHSGEKFKKDHALTTEIETVDVNAATSTTWTEIVGIITGV